jgi:anthranilate phosphoribosyltransferase
LCVNIDLGVYNAIDLCGTGGDGKNTFNISTLSSFVTAGAGVAVAKHGNYGVSSISGSSNVLEALGVQFSNDSDYLRRCMDQAGICILHAPLFHPAMKQMAPIRKELGIKTFFNMLGPMVNPAFPPNQMVGVFSLELARLYGYLYQEGTKRYAVVHDLAGYDEISLTGPVKVIERDTESIRSPREMGMEQVTEQSLFGGNTVEDSARIFLDILHQKGTKAQQQVVVANAGLAISVADGCSHSEGMDRARLSLESGAALESLQLLQKLSN